MLRTVKNVRRLLRNAFLRTKVVNVIVEFLSDDEAVEPFWEHLA